MYLIFTVGQSPVTNSDTSDLKSEEEKKLNVVVE